MAANQFVPFAYSGGAYTYTASAWASNGVRALGFPPGILPKENINTALRQATAMAQLIGQFTANHQSGDVLDNNDSATLLTQLENALIAFIAAHPGSGGGGGGTTVSVTDTITGDGSSGSPLLAAMHTDGTYIIGTGVTSNVIRLNLAALISYIFANVDCATFVATETRCATSGTAGGGDVGGGC